MTPERRGLLALLERHPELESHTLVLSDVWVSVDLANPRVKVAGFAGELLPVSLRRFAIWRETGNVYELDEHGAAGDDPTIVVTPL